MLVAVLSTRHIHRISIASSVIPIVTIEGQYRASKIIVTWRIKDENRCNGSFKSRLSSLNILQMLKHFWHSSAHKSIPRTPTADADAFLPNYLSARKRKLGVGRSWYKKNRARFNERRLSTSGSFQAISKHLKFFSKHSKTKVQIEQRRLTNSSFAATISRRLPFQWICINILELCPRSLSSPPRLSVFGSLATEPSFANWSRILRNKTRIVQLRTWYMKYKETFMFPSTDNHYHPFHASSVLGH